MKSKTPIAKDNPALSYISAIQQEQEAPQTGKVIQAIPNIPLQEEKAVEGKQEAPQTKSKRVQLILQPGTVEAIKGLAWKQKLSMNEAINRAIKEYIERHSN